MEATNILIADRHFVSRFGLAMLLREVLPSVRIYEARYSTEITGILQHQDIGLIICDVTMPGMENLGFVKRWRNFRPEVKIMVFTGYSERRNVVGFLRSGINGFLSKGGGVTEIQDAVLSVLNGARFVSETAKDMIVKNAVAPAVQNPSDLFKRLSGKEIRLLRLILKGYRSKEVANELGLHVSTVSHHKKRVFKKLGVSNLIELINLNNKLESYHGY